jgi:hypothetical protein
MVVVALAAFGCGKKSGDDKNKQPPAGSGAAAMERVPDKPKGEPPKDVYKGKNRLVNLYVGKDGKTQTVEVWVRRGFKYDPVKLAENIEFGKASTWFGVPEHMSPVVLPAGSKPDDKEISPMAYGKADEVVTGLLTLSRDTASVSAMYDVSKDMPQAPKPPAAGKGAVILYAGPLYELREAMTPAFGGSSFNVGDGTGACLKQRDPKMESLALGGTSPYALDLDPGKHTITLHKWPGPPNKEDRCKEAVFTIDVDVVADKSQWVFLYSPDQGKTIATLALPIGE